jgi:hypothetical protein
MVRREVLRGLLVGPGHVDGEIDEPHAGQYADATAAAQ